MVDDGSTINVCPLRLLPKFGINPEDLEQSNVIIRAYDDSKKPVVGTFKVVVTMGDIESVIEFTVLDIPSTFALLVGRPLFHPIGGIPSTMHQNIKFPLNGKVVTIPAETNNIITCLNIVPLSLQISVIHKYWINPKFSLIMKMMQYLPSARLGGRYTGVTEFPNFRGQTSKYGQTSKDT